MDCDVVIVGAGLAGATTARDLADRGLECAVVEARDRVGGRAWSRSPEGWGGIVELGASVYDPARERHVHQEVERYGIPTTTGLRLGGTRTVFHTGGQRRAGLPVPASELRGLEEAWIELTIAARQVAAAPVVDDAPLGALDTSGDQFFSRMHLGEATRDLIAANLTPFFGDLRTTSMLHVLERMAAYGGTPWSLRDHHARMFANGSSELVEVLLADSEAEMRLGFDVVHVKRDSDGVVVTSSDGRSVSARCCVLTVPKTPLAMQRITFEPALAPAKQRILQAPNQSQSHKVLMLVEGLATPLHAMGFPGPIGMLWTQRELPDGRHVCVAAGGHAGYDGDPFTIESAQAGIAAFAPEAKVVAIEAHDWNADPYAGGISTLRAPGAWLGSRRSLLELEEGVVLAGADVALGPLVNLLDGAVQSGRAAAESVCARLGAWTSSALN
jgi:monoamine oxidase